MWWNIEGVNRLPISSHYWFCSINGMHMGKLCAALVLISLDVSVQIYWYNKKLLRLWLYHNKFSFTLVEPISQSDIIYRIYPSIAGSVCISNMSWVVTVPADFFAPDDTWLSIRIALHIKLHLFSTSLCGNQWCQITFNNQMMSFKMIPNNLQNLTALRVLTHWDLGKHICSWQMAFSKSFSSLMLFVFH